MDFSKCGGMSDGSATHCQKISFKFSSPRRTFEANGMFARVEPMLHTAEAYGEEFFESAEQALKSACSSGVQNPILVGAIPFNGSACHLFVPLTHREISLSGPSQSLPRDVFNKIVRQVPPRDQFISMVNNAIDGIKRRELEKVVLSRALEIDSTSYEKCGELLFSQLATLYPDAYNFYLPISDEHYWLGASPELLLSRDGATVQSFPLAGSALKRNESDADGSYVDNLFSSLKDRHEHQLVVDDIARQLKPLCTIIDCPKQPSIVTAGKVLHLGTSISGHLKNPLLSSLRMALKLHPTPAVCGVPRGSARERIRELEPHPRGLYTGLVGWTDLQGNGEWAVIIRCGEYINGVLRLFAGAGIVDNSCALAEWDETAFKFSTMLRALGIIDGEYV